MLLNARRIVAGALCFALALPGLPAAAQPVGLPSMGAASADELSPDMERELGQAIMVQGRLDPTYIDDAELNQYLTSVGRKLAAHAPNPVPPIEMFGVLDPEINAFTLPGGFIGVIGRSGAGKSTMVNLLLRFFDVESGRILIDGKDISRVTQESLRANIAMVTQDTSLLHRSIRDNIRYGRPEASEAEIWEAARKAHCLDFIEQLEDNYGRRGFDTHVGERGVKLSGGQRQRVAMGRAIVRQPSVFLMDEPLSNLDAKLRVQMRAEIARLQHDLGVTTVYVTHDQVEAMTMGDRVAVLKDGYLQQLDTPRHLYASPDNVFVAAFIGQDRALRRLALRTLADVDLDPVRDDAAAEVQRTITVRNAVSLMLETGEDHVTVVNDGHRIGVFTLDAARRLL